MLPSSYSQAQIPAVDYRPVSLRHFLSLVVITGNYRPSHPTCYVKRKPTSRERVISVFRRCYGSHLHSFARDKSLWHKKDAVEDHAVNGPTNQCGPGGRSDPVIPLQQNQNRMLCLRLTPLLQPALYNTDAPPPP